MPIRTIKDPEQPLTASDLDGLESRLKITLPSDYRAFLLKHNGGHPIPSRFKYKLERGPYTDSSIDVVLRGI